MCVYVYVCCVGFNGKVKSFFWWSLIYLYLSLSISIYLYLSLSISIYLYLSLSISIYLYLSLSIYLYLSIIPRRGICIVEFLAILIALISKREEERWDFDCWEEKREKKKGKEVREKRNKEKEKKKKKLLEVRVVVCQLRDFHPPILWLIVSFQVVD